MFSVLLNHTFRAFSILLCTLSLSSCALLKPKTVNNDYVVLKKSLQDADSDTYREVVKTAGGNWLYGQGLGKTALNIGTTVAFPPYAVVLLGNLALDFAGYQPVGVSSFLSGDTKDGWVSFYDALTSAPGQATAAIASEEFRSEELAREKLIQAASRPAKQAPVYALNTEGQQSAYRDAEQLYWYH